MYRFLNTGLETCCFGPSFCSKSGMLSSFVSHLPPFIVFISLFVSSSSRDGKVCVVSRLRIGRPAIGIPERTKNFSVLRNIHTGSGTHPSFYPMGTGIKWPRCDVDHSQSSISRLRRCAAAPLLHLCACMTCTRRTFYFSPVICIV